MITREKFIQATGHEPENDDLERSNCTKAGELGHFSCGWDEEEDLPRFMTKPFIKKELRNDYR